MAAGLSLLSNVNMLIAVGSVDGLIGAIVCARVIKSGEGKIPEVIFTQAFQVDKIDVSKGCIVNQLETLGRHFLHVGSI